MNKIKVGIIGYGNLGKGVELSINQNPDMELIGVFTRRNPSSMSSLLPKTKFFNITEAKKMEKQIDVMILCGGSATDIPSQGPEFAKLFNTVDSFDTHANIPTYFSKMDTISKENSKVSIISTGWDPGLFSLNRAYFEAILPVGKTYTFWGKGVSQGHSDAIRRIKGVKNAVQYTIPIESAINKVRNGENPELSIREKHLRECFVVLEENADKQQIENEIKTMPNYFSDYETIVKFITEEDLLKNHNSMPHGGFVIRSGITNNKTKQISEFSLNLQSNPEFTANVLVSYARAAKKMYDLKLFGTKTVLDIPVSFLSPKTSNELIKELL